MKKNKILLLTLAIVAVGFFAAAMFMNKTKSPEIYRVPEEKLVKFHSPILGNPLAKVTIVEFLDPECEACAAFYPAVKGLLNDYKDQVRFVVRYMLYHGNSKLAAQATEAAGRQGKYWEMQAQLFYRTDWTHQETPQTAKLEEIATGLGVELEKFRKDMQDPGIISGIEADFQEGPTVGVTGTPTIFVNGRKLEELNFKTLKALIEEEIRLTQAK